MIKNTRFTKNTKIIKANLHTVKMPRKCVAMPTTDIFFCNPLETRDKENGRQQQRLCLFLQDTEILIDDQVTSLRFNSRYLVYFIRFNQVKFLAITIALNQQVSISITVTFTQNCAINYIKLTHKNSLDSHKNTRTLNDMKKHYIQWKSTSIT